jgi:hypothetical protein
MKLRLKGSGNRLSRESRVSSLPLSENSSEEESNKSNRSRSHVHHKYRGQARGRDDRLAGASFVQGDSGCDRHGHPRERRHEPNG